MVCSSLSVALFVDIRLAEKGDTIEGHWRSGTLATRQLISGLSTQVNRPVLQTM